MRIFFKIIIVSIISTAIFTNAYARSSRFKARSHRYSMKIAQIIINTNSINTLISKISVATTPKITSTQSAKPIANIAGSNAKIMLVKQMLINNVPAIQTQISSQLDANFSRMELRRLSSFLSFGVGKKFAELIVIMAGDIVINTAYQLQSNPNVNSNIPNIMAGGNNALMRGLAPAIMQLLQNTQTKPQSRSKFNKPFKRIQPIK